MRHSLRVGIVLAALVIAGGCGDTATDNASDETADAAAVPSVRPAREVRVLGELPAFELTDQTGEPFGSMQLSDKVWIATFIFTRCGSTCPKQTARMRGLQRRYSEHPRKDALGLVSITVDPEFDTHDVLATYAEDNGADPDVWRFLTGGRSSIWELSKSGFMLDVRDDTRDSDMPIVHSTQMVVIDSWGRIRGYYDGLDDLEVDRLHRDVEAVLTERHRVYGNSDLPEASWVAARRDAQLATRSEFGAFTEFQFEDRLDQTGITFVGRPTPDGGRNFKILHYDHGCGASLADVGGDGRTDIYLPNQVGGGQLWRNAGGGRFEDATERSGLRVRESVGASTTFDVRGPRQRRRCGRLLRLHSHG